VKFFYLKKIENGDDLNVKNKYGSTALRVASLKGNFDIVKLLVENGADLNAKNEYGDSALMAASLKGYFDIVKFLVANGADLNLENEAGHTALMEASAVGRYKISVYLLEHGASKFFDYLNGLIFDTAVNERIKEINKIRAVINAILFPCDEPVIAQIVGEFTDGLENLTKNIKNKNN